MKLRSWQARTGVIMALPTILGLVVFMFGPMIASLVISLTDWQIGASPTFVGVDNYASLISGDPLFWKSLWVTLYYTLLTVPTSRPWCRSSRTRSCGTGCSTRTSGCSTRSCEP
jgi:ABC-type sugar transport system permease subunit